MKPLVAILPLTAAAAVAASPTTGPQNVRQDVNRLVLLPGPYLTSPAKAPQPKPVMLASEGMVQIGVEPTFQFQTTGPVSSNGVMLGSGAEKKKDFAPAPKPTPPQNPEELRFDQQLPATAQPSLLKEKPKAAPAPAPTTKS